mgnify:CR=1 FL=1
MFINTPTSAEMVTFLGMGQVDIGLMPYTSFMALYDKGAPVKIVAGGGVEGCAIVARPGLDTPEKLKGKTLGTFQMDTLEVMPYDYLKKHKISFKDVKVRYMGNTPGGGRGLQGGRHRLDLHHRALRLGAGGRRQGRGHADRRHRPLRQGLHRLRAGCARQPDEGQPGRAEGRHQGHDAGPATTPRPRPRRC